MNARNATYYTYQTPHGPLTIGASSDLVTAITLGRAILPGACKPTSATNAASTQLLEYLAGKRRTFDFPYELHGSAFQEEVWSAVCQIPYGCTETASGLAARLGKANAHRSVGAALAKCPLAIVVPTHRVVGGTWKSVSSERAAGLRALEKAHS